MANLNTVQDHLETLKTGTPEQKKQKLTPESIADVRTFIADERAKRNQGTHYSLEADFHQWEDLVKKYESEKGQITAATANATASTAAGLSQADGVANEEQLTNTASDKIRESLEVINPDNLEKAINISEQVINLIKSEEAKTTLRGVHGAIIFDILRNAGHNLIMQNGQITIIPKPGTDVVNLQEKLQTLVNTKRISLDTIKLGMLYSSPSFKAYAENKKTKDATGKSIIDPKTSPQDFITYLRDLDKAGNKSGDIESILKSQSLLSGVNIPQAIKGFQDMGQVGEWKKNNEKILAQVETKLAAVVITAPAAPQSAPGQPVVPAEPNTTLTGKLTQDGVTGGHVTGVAGDSTKGLIHGLGDILSLGKGDPIATLAIGGGLIYGIYKAFQKFGFLGGLGTLFGLGAMNNIDKILGRFGVGSVSEAIDKVGKKAGEVADVAKDKIGGGTTDTPAKEESRTEPKKAIDVSGLSESQRAGVKSIESNKSLLEDIKNHAINNPAQNAPIEKYIEAIHKDSIQNLTLDKLVYTPHQEQSIFTENTQSLFGENPDILNTMSRRLLKQVIRSYLGINGPLSPSLAAANGNAPKREGQDTWDTFKEKYPTDKWKSKTLKDITTEIHKK